VPYVPGYPDDESLRQEVAADRFAVLPKPFTPSTLAKKVRETLDEE
jgi:two-component system, cell cycle sensor histidine kinase and response regulator CckA